MDAEQAASWEPAFASRDYRIEESVGYLIKRVRMAMSSAIDRELVGHEISHDQLGILLLINTGRGATAAELSREMSCDTSSMTRMIDRLEAKGFVKRSRSEDDRRIVFIVLTPSGKSLADQLPDLIVRVMNRHMAGFSRAEVELLKSLLRRMLDNAGESLPCTHVQPSAATHAGDESAPEQ
jgi:DNA-binding MarR family transcriptional regulator